MFVISRLEEIEIIKQNERQKLILTKDADGKKYLKRIIKGDKREIYKLLKKINHPNIPGIYYAELDSDTVIIEEYINGITLSDFIEQDKKINKKQLRSIIKQILSALEALHKSGIIHRDIKPDNIMIDEFLHVWLTDYDIARIYRSEVRRDTETLGTFGYAPIEQYGMLPTDFKTDIYAFGVTLSILLEHENEKGFLFKIAEKCKKVDPSERYQSAKKVKKAIIWSSLKIPMIVTLLTVLSIAILILFTYPQEVTYIKPESVEVTQTEQSEQARKPSAPESEVKMKPATETEKNNPTNTTPTEPKEEQERTVEDITFEGTFSGFQTGTKEAEYQNYNMYSQVCIFSMQSPWEHLIFIDDMNKNGKLKLGKNDTVVNADITLADGNLSINLNDDLGHTFNHKFRYNNQYEYTKYYTENIRKNADIICYDFNGDGGTELLIGLSEGSIGTFGKQFYNNVNYCIAWCITYNENTGFTLCKQDMFSKGYSFDVNESIRKLNVAWEEIGDTTGFMMDNDMIIAN